MAVSSLAGVAGAGCSETARTPRAAGDAAREAPPEETLQLDNPLVLQRADAQILHHTDGSYLFAATVPEYDRIELRRADTLSGLRDAPGVVVWRRHASGVMAAHIWAPEVHFIEGRWYIYFAAGSSTDVWAIRIYVLENASANPLEGEWTEKGQLVTNFESFALDATTFEHAGTRYLVWAQSDPSFENNSSLFIGKLANPWTLAGPGVRLSKPELEWETRGFRVNEGPAVLVRNGRVFITYSASATDANYCMGMLTASASSDLLDAASWSKSTRPVFSSSARVFGPGHNQFTTSPAGTLDLLVYHGRDYPDITGDPLDDPNRHTRIQPFTWNTDGTPHFGAPVANGPLLIEASPSTGR
ncbi:MAG TPA: glycoside hydrolase family 43 protein [Polyangiaceae bacterium]|nr:glycoside hydrolase family 43 protein [Polyangiaceae bacterium]